MKGYAPSRSPCPIGRASRLLGDCWVILILREAFLGIDRFDGFVNRLGINRAALVSRLGWLVEAGLIARDPPDAKSARYVLTESGRDRAVCEVQRVGRTTEAFQPRSRLEAAERR